LQNKAVKLVGGGNFTTELLHFTRNSVS